MTTLSRITKAALATLLLAMAGISSSVLLPNLLAADKTGKAAPAWELKDLEGKVIKSTDFKGKVVVLDFWATWCGPCVKEIPAFIQLQDQYGKDGLVIVGVSLDDGKGVVKKFVASKKVNYTVVMGNDQITKDFGGVEGIPTTFVIDRENRITAKHVGYTEKSVFEKDIKALLTPAK